MHSHGSNGGRPFISWHVGCTDVDHMNVGFVGLGNMGSAMVKSLLRAGQGKLFILPAGDHESVVRCQPLFDALGERSEYVGRDPQASNVIKLTCNTMIATMIEVLSESYSAIKKSGVVDPS